MVQWSKAPWNNDRAALSLSSNPGQSHDYLQDNSLTGGKYTAKGKLVGK